MSRAPPWRATLDGVAISCRLTPKGGRDGIDGVATLSDGARVLIARVRAPPRTARPTPRFARLIATRLGVPTRACGCSPAPKSRVKQIGVSGDPTELLARLESAGTTAG